MTKTEIKTLTRKLLTTSPDYPVQVRLRREVLQDTTSTIYQHALAKLQTHPHVQVLSSIEVAPSASKNTVFTRITRNMRLDEDIFLWCKKIGLPSSHPEVTRLANDLEAYLQSLFEQRPWNDNSLTKKTRLFKFMKARDLPGVLSLVKPNCYVVQDARLRATDLLLTHYRFGDFSIAFEKAFWHNPPSKNKIFTDETVDLCFQTGYDFNTKSSVFRDNVFRLINSKKEENDPAIYRNYCEKKFKTGRAMLQEKTWQKLVLTDKKCSEQRKSQQIIRHINELYDLRNCPNWKSLGDPFIAWLWDQQQDNGFWDFGPPLNGMGDKDRLRISKNWRKFKRYQDWTAQILLLLNRFYEE